MSMLLEFTSHQSGQAQDSQISCKDHCLPVGHHTFCDEGDDDFFLPSPPFLTPRGKVKRPPIPPEGSSFRTLGGPRLRVS